MAIAKQNRAATFVVVVVVVVKKHETFKSGPFDRVVTSVFYVCIVDSNDCVVLFNWSNDWMCIECVCLKEWKRDKYIEISGVVRCWLTELTEWLMEIDHNEFVVYTSGVVLRSLQAVWSQQYINNKVYCVYVWGEKGRGGLKRQKLNAWSISVWRIFLDLFPQYSFYWFTSHMVKRVKHIADMTCWIEMIPTLYTLAKLNFYYYKLLSNRLY